MEDFEGTAEGTGGERVEESEVGGGTGGGRGGVPG